MKNLTFFYAYAALVAVLYVGSSFSTMANETSNDVYVSDNVLDRVSVQWLKPKSFTDVKQPNSHREKFRKHVFSNLEKHLDKLAKALPEGQSLNVLVTDLDLAGRIEPASFVGLSQRMDDIRVMRSVAIPRIEFSYELVDDLGVVIKRDEVNLKNINYLQNIGISSRNRPFEHEKKMLQKWFEKHLQDSGV